MTRKEQYNIVIAGVGGQGNLLLSQVIGMAALESGFKVRIAEQLGIAQRGGAVMSHIRIGTDVYGALVPEHAADLLLGLEPVETLRVATRFVAPHATVVLNMKPLNPAYINLGVETYPAIEDIVNLLRQMTKIVFPLDLVGIAQKAGSARAMNSAMLGVAAGLDALPMQIREIRKAIKALVPKGTLQINMQAFELGMDYAENSYLRKNQ